MVEQLVRQTMIPNASSLQCIAKIFNFFNKKVCLMQVKTAALVLRFANLQLALYLLYCYHYYVSLPSALR